MTVGGLVFNGCASKSILLVDDKYKENKEMVKKPFVWKNIKTSTSSTLITKKSKPLIENGFKKKLNVDFNHPVMGSTAFGKASLYGEYLKGKRTASGDIFNQRAKTVAHNSLPFNTMLKVTNLKNNRTEIVRVNDRGNFSNGIILNISSAVAEALGMKNTQLFKVKIEVLGFDGVIVNQQQLLKNKKPEDCKDCYITVPLKNSRIISVGKAKKEVYSSYKYKKPVEKSTYEYEEDFSENIYARADVLDNVPLIENFSEKTAIQIGAFRQYAGAKVYAKKYNLLSNQYNVEIKENLKDDIPLYRVRIEGFSNEVEAKEFISRYGITGAFLVRK